MFAQTCPVQLRACSTRGWHSCGTASLAERFSGDKGPSAPPGERVPPPCHRELSQGAGRELQRVRSS